MPTTDADSRRGVRLRGGLPESNGLTPLAEDFVENSSKVHYAVATLKTAAVTHNTENDSKTASVKILGLEVDLTKEEQAAVQLVLERARVRRTGEAPLFDVDSMPNDPAVVIQMPGSKPARTRARSGD